MREDEGDCEDVPTYGMIGIDDADERRHWAEAFGVTEAVLLKAVQILGTSAAELRNLFCRDQ